MKDIISLNTALEITAKKVQFEASPVAYSWGNVDALLKWINAMNGKQIEKSLGLPGAVKYPLIWLVEGWRGKEVPGGLKFENVTFHLAINSNVESLNENRTPGFNDLYGVGNDFIQQLKWAGVKVNLISYTERANFSVTKRGEKESHTIDIWDTLIIQTELIINPNCLKRLYSA